MKYLAWSAFLLNAVLFGSYYVAAKESIAHISPEIFTVGQFIIPIPLAIFLLLWKRRGISRDILKQGSLLAGCLLIDIMLLTLAVKFTTATLSAFFPCLNGFIAILFTQAILHRPVPRTTWYAASIAGAGLLIMLASMPSQGGTWIGNSLSFLSTVCYTLYLFLFERYVTGPTTRQAVSIWPLLGVELLVLAVASILLLLIIGHWESVRFRPTDLLVLLYSSLFVNVIPLVLAATMFRYISATTVSFIYILEPVTAALAAFVFLHELLPVPLYIGEGVALCGVLLQTSMSVGRFHATFRGDPDGTMRALRLPAKAHAPRSLPGCHPGWLYALLVLALVLAWISAWLAPRGLSVHASTSRGFSAGCSTNTWVMYGLSNRGSWESVPNEAEVAGGPLHNGDNESR